MNILKIIGSLLGIGKDFVQRREETRALKHQSEIEIRKAEASAIVSRINTQTESDSDIDLVTARNKRFTSKDEIVTYLFLVPVFVATITPFIAVYTNDDWIDLDIYIRKSYESLDLLPDWYKYVIGAIVIDVLGFRSFARQLMQGKLKMNPFKKKDK